MPNPLNSNVIRGSVYPFICNFPEVNKVENELVYEVTPTVQFCK